MLAAAAADPLVGQDAADPAADDGGAVYRAYVVAESADRGYLVRFDGAEVTVERTVTVGLLPAGTEAPHGVDVSPGGDYWYVSIAHGYPHGVLRRFETGTNRLAGHVELGMFPSSVAVDPTGLFVFVANSNFHGDMAPSSVSVVFAPELVEAARIETCTMPHGSRFDPTGTRHYSTCMMDDQLVELDVREMRVSRRFGLAAGAEGLLPVGFTGYHGAAAAEAARPVSHHAGHGGAGSYQPECSPTWVQPSPDGRFAYVTCIRSHEVVEIDLERERISRRIPVPERPYNVDVTPDGRKLVVTHRRRPGAVSVLDRESGRLLAEIPTGRSHTHGIALTPDSRFAFVTSEGVRGESGSVDVIDLTTDEWIDRVHVGLQAAGVAMWKVERTGSRPDGGR